MAGLRYRPGCIGDVRHAIPLLQPERESLGEFVWSRLPALIPKLLEREVVKAYVIDEISTGRLRWFGLSAFVAPAALSTALQMSATPFRQLLFGSALGGAAPFLGQEQIAAGNSASDLILAVLLCQPDVSEYTESEGGLLFRIAYESFCFAHSGFGLADFWQEVSDRKRAEILAGLGLELHRKVVTEDGTENLLLRYTPERAAANPAYAMSFVFNRLPPRFGFSSRQQQLLESALLDVSDKDFAARHRLTDDAVKKRWRAIYDRVCLVEPSLAEAEGSGSNQRRLLLGYLRRHLEELRPYHVGCPQPDSPTIGGRSLEWSPQDHLRRPGHAIEAKASVHPSNVER